MAFNQSTKSEVRLFYKDAEGQPHTEFRRAHSEDMGESSNIDRFETVVDLWLAEALHQPEPLFVSVAFENFVDSPDCDEANKLGGRYLREKARSPKLVFASADDSPAYFE